jgi:hypothetical protein
MTFVSPELKIDLKAPEKIENLAEKLDENQQRDIATNVLELVGIDKNSMSDWLGKAKGYLDSIDSDINESAPKDSANAGSGNDQPPSTALTLSAVIQFTARITSALLSEPDLARASEPGGEALASWMSSQLRTVDPDWVTDTDPLVLHMAVTGLGWRKRWFDEHVGEYRSTWLPVEEVIVNANVKSLERAPRVTHDIKKYPYEILRSIQLGHWIDYQPRFDDIDPQELQEFYEVDMWLDMDGDGYDEPWTLTVSREDTPCVVKCTPRWSAKTVIDTKEMLIFRPSRRYYAYKMIPDPKGSFFPRGFGWLLNRIEKSADSLLASIDDTAKSSAQNGGIASIGGIGVPDKIELNNDTLTTIPTDGQKIGDVLSLFPAKQVSPGMIGTLDKVLTLGDRLAGTLNLLENAPASMTATLAKGILDNGAQVQNAVHRRLVGSITEELRAFAAMANASGHIPQGIDGNSPIEVTADPNMATEMHRGVIAQAYHDMLKFPMVFNPFEVGKRYAQTMRFPDPEKLMAPPMPKPQATPQEQSEFMLNTEKEKTARMKVQADAVLKVAQGMQALAETAAITGNLDGMRNYILQLEQAVGQMSNADSVGSGSPGMAQPPVDPATQVASGVQAGTANNGIAGGQPGQPNPAGGGQVLPLAANPAQLAAS